MFTGARAEITKLAADDAGYAQFLEGITLQALAQILEGAATVHTRAKDLELFKSNVDSIRQQYAALAGSEIELQTEGSLSDDLCVRYPVTF